MTWSHSDARVHRIDGCPGERPVLRGAVSVYDHWVRVFTGDGRVILIPRQQVSRIEVAEKKQVAPHAQNEMEM